MIDRDADGIGQGRAEELGVVDLVGSGDLEEGALRGPCGMETSRLSRWEGVTTVSFCPPMTMVGTRSVVGFCEGE